MKDDDIVDSVEEFGFKMFAQHLRYGFAYLFFIVTHGLNLTRTEIRSHDEDGVLKINCPAFRVSQTTVIEDLEQHIKNVWVRFFDLIKENHAIRPAPHCFSQLAAFFVYYISRRRANHASDRVLFYVLGIVTLHYE